MRGRTHLAWSMEVGLGERLVAGAAGAEQRAIDRHPRRLERAGRRGPVGCRGARAALDAREGEVGPERTPLGRVEASGGERVGGGRLERRRAPSVVVEVEREQARVALRDRRHRCRGEASGGKVCDRGARGCGDRGDLLLGPVAEEYERQVERLGRYRTEVVAAGERAVAPGGEARAVGTGGVERQEQSGAG